MAYLPEPVLEGFGLNGEDQPYVTIGVGRRLVNVSFNWVALDVPSEDSATLPGRLPGVTPARALVEAASVVQRKRVRDAYDDRRRRNMVTYPRVVERSHRLLRDASGAAVMLDILASGELSRVLRQASPCHPRGPPTRPRTHCAPRPPLREYRLDR